MLLRIGLLFLALGWFALTTTPATAAEVAADAAPKFTIEGYQITGNTLLPAAEIQFLLAPFTGPQRDFGTVQEALDALQAAYRSRGYRAVAVLLPEQELKDGMVQFQVVEPRLKQVTISGNHYFSDENIRRSLPDLQEGKILNIDAISRSLQVANENPAKKLSMALQSTATTEEIEAQLKVVDSRLWHAGVRLDDTGTDETGDLRIGVLFSHANLFDRDQLLTLQYITSQEKPDRVGIYALGYRLPFYTLGDSLDLFAAYSDVDSGNATAGVVNLAVAGQGAVFGLRYNQNFARRGSFQQRLSYGVDYRNYDNQVSFSGTPLDNEITIHPLSLNYGVSWQGSKAATTADLSLVHNVAGGANGDKDAFDKIRLGANPNYNLVRLAIDLLVSLPAKLQLHGRWSGQYTNNQLVPGEYFGLGGADSVRGFDEREVADDRGYFLSAELHTPDLAPLMHLPDSQLILLGFYDSGRLDRVNALPGEINRTSIGSVGGGLRFQFSDSVTARGDYGYVLDGAGTSPRGSSRCHFSISYIY